MDSRTIRFEDIALHAELGRHETLVSFKYLNIVSTKEMVCRDSERDHIVSPNSHSHH